MRPGAQARGEARARARRTRAARNGVLARLLRARLLWPAREEHRLVHLGWREGLARLEVQQALHEAAVVLAALALALLVCAAQSQHVRAAAAATRRRPRAGRGRAPRGGGRRLARDEALGLLRAHARRQREAHERQHLAAEGRAHKRVAACGALVGCAAGRRQQRAGGLAAVADAEQLLAVHARLGAHAERLQLELLAPGLGQAVCGEPRVRLPAELEAAQLPCRLGQRREHQPAREEGRAHAAGGGEQKAAAAAEEGGGSGPKSVRPRATPRGAGVRVGLLPLLLLAHWKMVSAASVVKGCAQYACTRA